MESTHKSNMETQTGDFSEFHQLFDKWTLYAHLPHDTDWSIDSYKTFLKMDYLEQSIAVMESLPEVLVKNCMLFLMKNNIKPIWEDPGNRNGGCFSYKVPTKDIYRAWKNLCYCIIGNNVTSNDSLKQYINGATISPKRNFYIVKIWTSNCNIQSISSIIDIPGLDKQGVIFKKHKPEY
jgi:hypothetical protein